MTNLWEFLLQTMEVSWAALFLLILKHLLADKLSPRWQYGIWGLFFVKLLVPAGVTGKYLLAFPAVMLQTVREAAESVLSSRFCTADAPIRVAFGLPWFPGNPQSLTDWLFILYLAGAVVCLGRYFFSYVCLRLLLRSGKSVSAEFQTRMDALCSRYHLKACRTVLLPDLPSAFICGVCSPVLALPSEEVDDKILLHELLHLRSMDALQSIFWSIFRSIHWCNPFLQYVFHRIGNDMESLCDQRVLERLEGEERRRYGEILLNMTNDRYPRAPGTTSLSNGGRNIRSRIRAIARFRKYPQGMGLVSVCIAVTLFFPLLSGVSQVALPGSADSHKSLFMESLTEKAAGIFSPETAAARLAPCTTAAGALDTFAKGLMYLNPVWLTASSPDSAQEQVTLLMDTVRTGSLQFNGSFYVYNPEKQEDQSYRLLLVFPTDHLYSEGSSLTAGSSPEEPSADSAPTEQQQGYFVFPVTAFRDADGSWAVKSSGSYRRVISDNSIRSCGYGSDFLPVLTAEKEGATGTFSRTSQYILQVQQLANSLFDTMTIEILNYGPYFSPEPDTDAAFASAFYAQTFSWTEKDAAADGCSLAELYVTFPYEETEDLTDREIYDDIPAVLLEGNEPYVSADAEPGAANWNGQISTGSANSFDSSSRTGSFPELPETAFCRFFLSLDGTVRERVIFTGKEERSAVLLRPVVMLLGIWEAVCWIAVLFTGNSISLSFPLVQLICSVLTLYFHFQFFTNLASIAAAHDLPEYSRQMLYVRTVSTIYSAVIDVFFWFYPLDSVSGTIQIFLVITALCIILWMALTLFQFRKAEKRQF